ncbi:MAG: murein hydrolase activator EnvC family protein [Bacteriovoracia bacterium]
MSVRIIGLITIFFTMTSVYSQKLTIREQKRMANKYKKELKQQNSKLSKLKDKITELENELGNKNDKYISSMDRVKSLTGQLEQLQYDLIDNEKEIKDIFISTKMLLMKYLSSSLEEKPHINELYTRPRMKELVEENLQRFGKSWEQNQEIQEQSELLQMRLNEYRTVETELHYLVLELEQKKKNIASDYVKAAEEKKLLNVKLQKLKPKLSKLKTVNVAKYRPPIDDYSSFKRKGKGIDFFYTGIKPVKAVSKGKVVYSGELASYGYLVMVDHGNDIRSVILGHYEPIVRKNDWVDSGAILGHTVDTSKMANVYLEIRKKNLTQNTIKWLDTKKLARR